MCPLKPFTPFSLEITRGPKRPSFSQRKSSPDEKYHVTLYPGVNLEIQCPFLIIYRTMHETGYHSFKLDTGNDLVFLASRKSRGGSGELETTFSLMMINFMEITKLLKEKVSSIYRLTRLNLLHRQI